MTDDTGGTDASTDAEDVRVVDSDGEAGRGHEAGAGDDPPGGDAEGGQRVSRRGALSAIAGLGVLGIGATGSASAATSHNHLGESWSGSPSSGHGLKVEVPGSHGLFGNVTASSGNTNGVLGISASSSGRGVFGWAQAEGGPAKGVLGQTDSTAGTGVEGKATAESGGANGVVGQTGAPEGVGVFGRNSASGEEAVGVWGETAAEAGYGLATPNHARIDGTLDTAGSLDVYVDGDNVATLYGTNSGGEAGSVILGHPRNGALAAGSVIAGGGDGGSNLPNEAFGYFQTIGGGRGNEVSSTHPGDSIIAGGRKNTITGDAIDATVGGGRNNTIKETAKGGTVGGGVGNLLQNSAKNATIGGGDGNEARKRQATIAGGYDNQAYGELSTVGGGYCNRSHAKLSTISGGENNEATGTHGTIGGGDQNKVTAAHATVAGGKFNKARGKRSAVLGGRKNTADGDVSTALGGVDAHARSNFSMAWGHNVEAKAKMSWVFGRAAETLHPGSIVIADATGSSTGIQTSIGKNTMAVEQKIYANGGVDVGSSREMKHDVEAVDPQAILERARNLDVKTWKYDGDEERFDDGAKAYMGPMAEDFHEQFDLGTDETISQITADGVAFASIQGLAELRDEKEARIEAQRERIEELETERAELEDRLAAAEAKVGIDGGPTAAD